MLFRTPGGEGKASDILNKLLVVSGALYRNLLSRSGEVNAAPMTGYKDKSTAAIDITEDNSDGGAAGGLVRDKRGNIIMTCGISRCQYRGSSSHMKMHKASKHGIDVVWFSCDQDGCDYKAKQAGDLKKHKQNVHD
ncbi:hypothetical protein TrVE_jg811 [Triparma verrucosa]|uniref:C2H2-type domain-containing protein n=1 Tax=Triparma verrucosa TaxID=1606542 RepID=A0A9W7BPW6_9STRA|nr:hypothetical protein TrVE_jg811 [Triparma verrucosa]